jgi:hypothetical protein
VKLFRGPPPSLRLENTLTTIDRIPPEILAGSRSGLWNARERNRDVAALGRVLTRTCLGHSKSFTIDLSPYETTEIHSHDLFFQIIPHATRRPKFLCPRITRGYAGYHLSPTPSCSSPRVSFRCAETCHAATSECHPHSSIEISPRYVCCVWRSFAPSHLGGTWSTSPRSCPHAPHRERSPSDSFLASLKTPLASKKSNFALQPQRLAFKMDDWYHWRV